MKCECKDCWKGCTWNASSGKLCVMRTAGRHYKPFPYSEGKKK